jgi:hypothetical protein
MVGSLEVEGLKGGAAEDCGEQFKPYEEAMEQRGSDCPS